MGAYPTAPYPWNNHCIIPDITWDAFYYKYSPLFERDTGHRWMKSESIIWLMARCSRRCAGRNGCSRRIASKWSVAERKPTWSKSPAATRCRSAWVGELNLRRLSSEMFRALTR
jgi:hypothetical protein